MKMTETTEKAVNKKITYYLPDEFDKKLSFVAKKYKTTKGELIMKAVSKVFDGLPNSIWVDFELDEAQLDTIIEKCFKKK